MSTCAPLLFFTELLQFRFVHASASQKLLIALVTSLTRRQLRKHSAHTNIHTHGLNARRTGPPSFCHTPSPRVHPQLWFVRVAGPFHQGYGGVLAVQHSAVKAHKDLLKAPNDNRANPKRSCKERTCSCSCSASLRSVASELELGFRAAAASSLRSRSFSACNVCAANAFSSAACSSRCKDSTSTRR